MNQALMRRWKRHHCTQSDNENRVVWFNDYAAKVDGITGITEGCPFCWTSFMTLRRDWWEAYRKRARVATPEEVASVVAEIIQRLERPYWPREGIVNHFGPYANARGLGIHVSRRDKHYLVTMYQEMYRRPATLHLARAEAVAQVLGCKIIDSWNGKDGSDGISIVLSREAPDSLHRALDNYLAMQNVFERTDANEAGYLAFQRWYDAPLAEAA